MSNSIKIRRGLSIRLNGEADKIIADAGKSTTYAIKPTDFHGLTPKLTVKVGDSVKIGSVLFFDKYDDRIKYTSPVSGEIAEIKRGEKRKILEVKIKSNGANEAIDFGKVDPKSASKDAIVDKLLSSGIWSTIRQRPVDIVANPSDTPKSIFISGFDSSPLAPDYDFILHGKEKQLQAGIDALGKLTSGNVNVTIRTEGKSASAFSSLTGIQLNTISGPHPAGNVGVQIHNIDPINKGETIWYVTPQDLLTIGNLFLTGEYDSTRIVAMTGAALNVKKYVRTTTGASMESLLDGIGAADNVRYISGNVLTGSKVELDGYLGFYHHQVTVVTEGNDYRFLLGSKGWLGLGLDKFSNSRAYPTWLMPNKKYDIDTNLNGEVRSFVMTGQYDKVFPFDIYPVELIKSVMINDIEAMENLGIYEVAPEDFALCEFVCTSKINSQDIIRQGLDVIKEECL